MNEIKVHYHELEEPVDYFSGLGGSDLPTPKKILLFTRSTKKKLQEEVLQNRSHHRFVLIFNRETFGHIHVNTQVLEFEEGSAFLIHPYQFHHFSHLRQSNIAWIFCTFELENAGWLEPLRNQVVVPSSETVVMQSELFQQWIELEESGAPTILQEQQLQTALINLLLSLKTDQSHLQPELLPIPKDDLVRAINQLMAEHQGSIRLINDLADALHLSESRLRTRFKEIAGISLGAYIRNYRINRAMSLLRTTQLPISTVAEESGFGSPQAFSRIFKLKTGESPRSYRNSG